MEVGFNFDIRGDILPATKMYHYRFVFAYCIGNGNYGVVLKKKKKKGEIDVAVLQRLEFIIYWKKGPFLTLQHARPMLCLAPLVWLFPPPIT